MSNTSIFINTAATDIAKAKTISLAQLATQGFPVLAYGDLRPFDFYFHNQGTIEAFSGNASYGLRATLGNVNSGPFGGTYTLTCGSTSEALANDTDAAGLQDELNLLTSVISGGGIDVTGEFPDFFLTWRTVGSKTAITASAINLVPDSGIVLTTLTAGDGTHTERIALTLRQNAISSTTTFSTITSPYNGWTGTLDTSTNGALALLLEFGESVGDFVQVNTVLTLELITPAGKYVTYFQGHVVLRAKNVDLGATGSASISQYVIQGPITTSGLTMNTARLLGRSTDGVGAVEELTVGTGLTLSGGVLSASGSLSNPMTSVGDMIIGGASGTPTRLAGGTDGYVLTMVSGAPAWAAGGSGSGTVTSVAMSTPTFLTVAGSPITTSGTLALTWSGLTTNGLMQATGATAMSSTLTPTGLTSIGVNSVTSASGQDLILSTLDSGANILIAPNGAGTVFIGTSGSTTNRLKFQPGSAILDSGNQPLTIIRNGGSSNLALVLGASLTTGARLLSDADSQLKIQAFAGGTTLATFTGTATTLPFALSVTGHTTFEGVTSTGATGTGKLVYDTSPTLVTPALGTPSSGTLTNTTGFPADSLAGTTLASNVVTSSLTSVGTLTSLTTSGTITATGGAPTIDADAGDGTISATGGGKWIVSSVFKLGAGVQDSAGGLGSSGQVLKSNGSGVLTYGNDAGSYTITLLGCGSGSLAASTTAYLGWNSGVSSNATQGRYKVYIPKTGTIKNIVYYMFGGGGDAGHSVTVDVFMNNATSVGSQTLVANVFPGIVAATGLSQAVTGNGTSGDYVEFRIVSPSGMTTITSANWSCQIYIETSI